MRANFVVAIGAIIGAGLRYGITSISQTNEVWLTLLINLVGCFVLGYLLIHGERFLKLIPKLQNYWRLFLATGLLGGFTTTSAFSVQSIQFIQAQEFLEFSILFVISILGGLLSFHFAQTLALRSVRR